jgi:hypothetical protein
MFLKVSILSRQRGALRRQCWYRALGTDARAVRVVRSHAATYRAVNQRRRTLYALAADDRQRAHTLSAYGGRWHSVTDPAEAEVLRIRCELYSTLAQGCDVEQAFQASYERAKAVCERYNAAQERRMRASWHPTDSGHFSADEAWTRLRHAVQMYRGLL